MPCRAVLVGEVPFQAFSTPSSTSGMRATGIVRSRKTGPCHHKGVRISATRPEHCRAHAHDGCAFGDGGLEILRHAHRQRVERVSAFFQFFEQVP